MKKIKIGHIGWLARDEGPDCETVAWCDINEEKMKSSAAKNPDITMYTDYRAMVEHPDLNAVVISTPNWVHAEQATAFMEAGKSVFLEKPMGINRNECDDLLRTAMKTGVNFTIDFEMRVSPFAERVKGIINSGEYGKLLRMEMVHHRGAWLESGNGMWRVRPEKSGGHFLMEPIHTVDIFRYFAGDITAVQTVSGPNVLSHYQFPDNLCCHMFFESGVQGTILASHSLSSWLSWEDQQKPDNLLNKGHDMCMVFIFEGAAIQVDFIRARIVVNLVEEYPAGSGGKRLMYSYTEEVADGDMHKFAHDIAKMRMEFIHRCATGKDMVQDPIDIWKTHLVCLAAETSMMEDFQRIKMDYTLPVGMEK